MDLFDARLQLSRMLLAVKSSLEHDGQGADLLEPELSDGEERGYIENMRFGKLQT